MLAVGFSDSIVKVWTLVPQKLKSMKTAEQLQDVNVDAEDVLVRIKFLFVAAPNSTLYN
jgi:transcription initiation factor TFIID subunit 5